MGSAFKFKMIVAVALFAALIFFYETNAVYENQFETIQGCLQYNSYQGKYHAHPYLSTAAFRNIETRPNGTLALRLGVLGKNDGYIRLTSSQYPYDKTLEHEIQLGGSSNTLSLARHHIRTDPKTVKNETVLNRLSTLGILSEFKPLLFTIAIHTNGWVTLTEDNDSYPFLEFTDLKLSSQYISFANWDVPVIFFFDCPFS